ncbi:MAG: hypothetical protein FWF28_00505 [Micrococcales bacterium]|nr:hypothetical protein [Micrococcales bacterium]
MTDDQPRRPRRVVRPAGSVGGDESNLRSSCVAPSDEVRQASSFAVSLGSGPARPTSVRRAPDDEDVGWGAPVADSNDDRLRRDRPPHW